MLHKQTLVEVLDFSQSRTEMLEETTESGKKNLYMKGIFVQGGIKNHNERIYPVSEIRNAVKEINDKLSNKFSVWGELDHPEELTINLDRVSHMITEMWMEGNNGLGKLKILPTPMGQIARTLIECDGKLGVSSRGVGEVSSSGHVQDFSILTIDLVAQSSAPDAYPKPVYESLNARRGRVIQDLAESVMNDPKAQKHLTKELLAWINKL